MELIIQEQEKEVLAEFNGRLDTPASLEIAPQTETLMSAAAKTIILDCTNMDYISSAGLRIFMKLRKASAEKGGKIILKGLNEVVSDVFMMVGLLNLFEVQ